MVSINKSLILNSHRTKWIIRKNVWQFNLKTIMLQHSYILDVQILSTNEILIEHLSFMLHDQRLDLLYWFDSLISDMYNLFTVSDSFWRPSVVRPSDFSIIHLENKFSLMYDMPDLPVSQALLCHIEKYF